MNRREMLMGGAAAAGVLGLAGPVSALDAQGGSVALNALFQTFFEENLAAGPELATRLGLDSGELAWTRGRLNDRSMAGFEARKARTAGQHARLSAFDRASVSGMDGINYDSVLFALQSDHRTFQSFDYGAGPGSPYVFSHAGGAYQGIPQFLANQHGIRTEADAETYLERASAIAAAIDAESEWIRRDAARGVQPPDFLHAIAMSQRRAALAQPAGENVLVTALRDQAAEKGFSPALAQRAETIQSREILPALARQLALLEEIQSGARPEAGVWRLPDGEAFYAASLHAATTSHMTPDEVHEEGVALAEDVLSRMDAAFRAQGMTQGTVGERMRALQADQRFIYPNTPEGRDALIAAMNVKLERVAELSPRYFGRLPTTPVEARMIPPDRAGVQGPGYYQPGSLDGTRPGVVFLNLRDTAELPVWMAQTVTYHESSPGHHFQVSLQQEAGELPMIRRAMGYSGYAEGWGLYAEQLADEWGLYDDDPFGRIGYLQSALFRAGRMVVDTGVHARRWTREQAVEWMVSRGAASESMTNIEVNRYCAGPGQAASYMVGRQTWNRLRARAASELGERFSIRDFHDIALGSGAMPLMVLEAQIDAWIANVR